MGIMNPGTTKTESQYAYQLLVELTFMSFLIICRK